MKKTVFMILLLIVMMGLSNKTKRQEEKEEVRGVFISYIEIMNQYIILIYKKKKEILYKLNQIIKLLLLSNYFVMMKFTVEKNL